MDDVFVYVIDLPGGIAEVVTPCLDGYTVYLNAKLTDVRQREAYLHAVGHIKRRDWEKFDVQSIEDYAHK